MSYQPMTKASTSTGQHNIQTQIQITIPPAGFEPAIPATKRPRPIRLGPRGHWHRKNSNFTFIKIDLLFLRLAFNLSSADFINRAYVIGAVLKPGNTDEKCGKT
jgi:hypothetical protein